VNDLVFVFTKLAPASLILCVTVTVISWTSIDAHTTEVAGHRICLALIHIYKKDIEYRLRH